MLTWNWLHHQKQDKLSPGSGMGSPPVTPRSMGCNSGTSQGSWFQIQFLPKQGAMYFPLPLSVSQMWQALIFTDSFYSASVNSRQMMSFQYFGQSESSWRLCRKGSRLQATTQIATSVILAPVTPLRLHTHVLMGFLMLLCSLLCFPKVSGTIQFLLM